MLKKIFESTLVMGTGSMLVMALDVGKVKVLALYLGPAGVGAISILNHYHVMISSIVALGLGPGIVKFVAQCRSSGDDGGIQDVVSTCFMAVFCLSLAAVGLSVIFGSQISLQLLEDPGHYLFILIIAVSFPIGAYPVVTASLLQGYKKIKSLARINVLRSIIALSIIVPLVCVYRLKGAVFSVVIVAATHLVLNCFYLRKENIPYSVFKWGHINPGLFIKIFPYGLSSLCVGSAYYLSHLVMKMIIVNALGLEMNGVYQPVWALSMTYLTLVLSSISAYSFPRLCEIKTNPMLVEELNGILRVALMLIVPAMFILLLARRPIILVLYSSDFLSAADILPVQILGDFFKVMWWSIGMFLLPHGYLIAFIALNLLQDIMLIALSYLLVNPYQLYGIAAAFSSSYLIALVALLVFARMKLQFRLWPNNRILVLASFIAINLLIVSELWGSAGSRPAVILLAIGSWMILSIKRDELLQLKKYIFEKFLPKSAN